MSWHSISGVAADARASGRQHHACLGGGTLASVTSAPPTEGASPMTKVTPFLMFNDQLEAAMAFYTATFPDSRIRNVARTGTDGPIASAEFVVGGQVFMGYNGGGS